MPLAAPSTIGWKLAAAQSVRNGEEWVRNASFPLLSMQAVASSPLSLEPSVKKAMEVRSPWNRETWFPTLLTELDTTHS